ncbi:hypothetical protein E4N62_24985 [Streptomyces sp. MNU76]|uniref:hypothetical protein n=1 Tax=Streptomyces sp. MNU76 TaxID=2560026 RepID=UPI001E5532E4|nr:hypothetical protein [Streptomyces sp. MNU76]MCC9708227.1 hypothetical protein [Streptomyces sp. MNU76]
MTKPVVHEPYAVRALTLWQPYASAVAVLGKDIENRGWSPTFRGLILVHAGLGTDRVALRHVPHDLELPRGAVVAVARISGAHTDCDGQCSTWADLDSEWHWELSDVVRLPTPVTQVKGRQRIWVPDDPLRHRVAAALPQSAADLAAHLRKEPAASTSDAACPAAPAAPAQLGGSSACLCTPTR